jgi:hypothetical protein
MHMQQIMHLSFDQNIVAHSEYQLEVVASKIKEKKTRRREKNNKLRRNNLPQILVS